MSPSVDGPSVPPMAPVFAGVGSGGNEAPRDRAGVVSPAFGNNNSHFERDDGPQQAFKPSAQQPFSGNEAQHTHAPLVRDSSHLRQQEDPVAMRTEETPRVSPDRSNSLATAAHRRVESQPRASPERSFSAAAAHRRAEDQPRASHDRSASAAAAHRRFESQHDTMKELAVDSGVGSSPALSQLNDNLSKELESEKSKNAWLGSELALARKAGYSRSISNGPALDERSADAFAEEDRPLVEALLKMRAELNNVQGSIEGQATAAAARIAEVEKQRDAAISEAVFAKAKLAATGGTSPMLNGEREGTPDADRSTDMNRRLASSLAAQAELSRRIDSLIHEKEAEKAALQLAEETADAAQKRVTDLDMDRQEHTSEIESLRSELHEAQKMAREVSVNHSEVSSAHTILLLDHKELTAKHQSIVDQSKNHNSMLASLREALAASTEKANLLEEKLDEERKMRNELEEKLRQSRSQLEDRTSELEILNRRLRDTEELAEKHAAEARTHRQAVLDGLDNYTSRDIPEANVSDERVVVLQQQIESANLMVRQNQSAADAASEKLRRAEERIAGLEAYQEQASREGLSMRKQLQSSLKETKALNEEKVELQQQLQSQQLETNAISVQHGALKNLLSERGVNPTEARKSRVLDSPGSQVRFGTPDLVRVKELEQQLEASLKSHDDMKTHLEDMQDREGLTRKEYEEKLSALDNDHQAAVKYLRGTEKMLSKMKQELQRVKGQATDYQKELESIRSKEGGSRSQTPAGWEQERDGLRKDLERMQSDLESKIASLHTELGNRESDIDQLKASHDSTRNDFTYLQSTHEASQKDLERLGRENALLDERARAAENKVKLLLDQVESSVDNYRRQSTQQYGMNGAGHRRGLSNVSATTDNTINAGLQLPTHRRGESLGAESMYSESFAPSEVDLTQEHGGPDERNSLALDSLASELDALRSHWETTNKTYRISSGDYYQTPTQATAPSEFGGLASWRAGLADNDEDYSRPSTSDSTSTAGKRSAALHQ